MKGRLNIFDPARMAVQNGTFSKPKTHGGQGPPAVSWIFAANDGVSVFDENTLAGVSHCDCNAAGLAVDPRSGDLAIGTYSGTVTIWHVGRAIKQFATLALSGQNVKQEPVATGLAYDGTGNLYVAHESTNQIDFFSRAEIKAGGGNPIRTLSTTNLEYITFLAAQGSTLIAEGYNSSTLPIIVSVDTNTGSDAVLQMIPELGNTYMYGIVFDKDQNLIANTTGESYNLIFVFPKPWTGSPSAMFKYGRGADDFEYAYYTDIALDATQTSLWSTSLWQPYISEWYTNVQGNTYPLGGYGQSTQPIEYFVLSAIAIDPQAK